MLLGVAGGADACWAGEEGERGPESRMCPRSVPEVAPACLPPAPLVKEEGRAGSEPCAGEQATNSSLGGNSVNQGLFFVMRGIELLKVL